MISTGTKKERRPVFSTGTGWQSSRYLVQREIWNVTRTRLFLEGTIKSMGRSVFSLSIRLKCVQAEPTRCLSRCLARRQNWSTRCVPYFKSGLPIFLFIASSWSQFGSQLEWLAPNGPRLPSFTPYESTSSFNEADLSVRVYRSVLDRLDFDRPNLLNYRTTLDIDTRVIQ